MMSRSQRQLANYLRDRLRGNVPWHILDKLADEQLIGQYHRHMATKAQLIADRSVRRVKPEVTVMRSF